MDREAVDFFGKFFDAGKELTSWSDTMAPEEQHQKVFSAAILDKLKARQQEMTTKSMGPPTTVTNVPPPPLSTKEATLKEEEKKGGLTSRSSNVTERSSSSSSNESDDGSSECDSSGSDFGSSPTNEKERDVAGDSGLQGDFLSFSKPVKNTSTLTVEELTATVSRPSVLLRAVPLWSKNRFENEGGYCTDARLALHQEVMDLSDYLRPTKNEVHLRRLAEIQIADIASRLWPGCNPCVYGSMTTHLLLPLSDVDISILDVPVSVEQALTSLAHEIAKAQLCIGPYPQLILKTKVPLVKFTHRSAKVDIDISVNAGDGKVNTEVVLSLLSEFPEARDLIVIIKYFLQQREMHEPYRGGLGSFATTLLVISFLQHHPIYTYDCGDRERYGMGRLLVDFFRYFGTCFNFHRVAISLDNQGFYFLKPNSDSTGRGVAQVVIEDPGNRQNNAASSLRFFQNVVQAFEAAYYALTGVFDPVDPALMSPDAELITLRPTLLSRIIHIDSAMIERRKAMQEAYDEFVASETPSFVNYVHQYKKQDDTPLLSREPASGASKKSHSTSKRRRDFQKDSPKHDKGSDKKKKKLRYEPPRNARSPPEQSRSSTKRKKVKYSDENNDDFDGYV